MVLNMKKLKETSSNPTIPHALTPQTEND